jgi:hypothetical protein
VSALVASAFLRIAPVAASDCRLKIWRLLRMAPELPLASTQLAVEAFFHVGMPSRRLRNAVISLLAALTTPT